MWQSAQFFRHFTPHGPTAPLASPSRVKRKENGPVQYPKKYFDDTYEYRHVVLPSEVVELLHKDRLLSERAIGVQQSRGPVHYAIHRPDLYIMLFSRLLNYQQENQGQPAGKQ
ncbi:Cyclin-dependent kinases regulatory subunit 2 [Nymphaea thermarum]|nr:Cyclin-dependent kinases regulatory subunit 2 [Nymphaea thermarum]